MSKRRQDGTVRPAVQRYRKRKKAEQRAEWLRRFSPGARRRFFKHADVENAIWLNAASRKLGRPRDETAQVLESLAEKRRWMKLRTTDGVVVGIAPPKRRAALDGRPGEV